jgi:hypothetical protein
MKVGGNVWRAEEFMLKSHCVKLQNKVQDKYPFFASMEYLFPLRKNKLGGITFQQAFVE